MSPRTEAARAKTLPREIPLAEMRSARERIAASVLRTPLVRFDPSGSRPEVYLKLENLQAIGSFKLRGAANAMLQADPEALRDGVWTASAGNMAQGVAWCARLLRVPCRVVVPDHAPAAKTEAVERLGGEIVRVPFAEWWQIIVSHEWPGAKGLFVHPVSDRHVIAGNASIGLEIAEDAADVDTVIVPYGGGGLSCGIASALRAVAPNARVYAAEVETAAPFAAALAAGKPVAAAYTASFVDGIGGRTVLEEMWPLASHLLSGSLVVSLRQVADAVRLLLERAHVVAEGAGAAALAAALAGKVSSRKIVCVVSGGNIDSEKLVRILSGAIP
ncbi:MAG: threonine ammonia-lyase [Gemmatimonadaceae bacterium]